MFTSSRLLLSATALSLVLSLETSNLYAMDSIETYSLSDTGNFYLVRNASNTGSIPLLQEVMRRILEGKLTVHDEQRSALATKFIDVGKKVLAGSSPSPEDFSKASTYILFASTVDEVNLEKELGEFVLGKIKSTDQLVKVLETWKAVAETTPNAQLCVSIAQAFQMNCQSLENYGEAAEHYLNAAALGHPEAKSKFYELYEKVENLQTVVPSHYISVERQRVQGEDNQRKRKLLSQLLPVYDSEAKKGDLKLLKLLATIYKKGKVIEEDFGKAAEYFLAIASSDSAEEKDKEEASQNFRVLGQLLVNSTRPSAPQQWEKLEPIYLREYQNSRSVSDLTFIGNLYGNTSFLGFDAIVAAGYLHRAITLDTIEAEQLQSACQDLYDLTYKTKDFSQQQALLEIYNSFETSADTPARLYAIANCYQAMGQFGEAAEYYISIANNAPNKDEKQKAKSKLYDLRNAIAASSSPRNNFERVRPVFLREAEKGDVKLYKIMADEYLEGTLADQNFEEAARLYVKFASSGSATAAMCHTEIDKQMRQLNPTEARQAFQRVKAVYEGELKSGNNLCHTFLGELYLRGSRESSNEDRNLELSIRSYHSAKQSGIECMSYAFLAGRIMNLTTLKDFSLNIEPLFLLNSEDSQNPQICMALGEAYQSAIEKAGEEAVRNAARMYAQSLRTGGVQARDACDSFAQRVSKLYSRYYNTLEDAYSEEAERTRRPELYMILAQHCLGSYTPRVYGRLGDIFYKDLPRMAKMYLKAEALGHPQARAELLSLAGCLKSIPDERNIKETQYISLSDIYRSEANLRNDPDFYLALAKVLGKYSRDNGRLVSCYLWAANFGGTFDESIALSAFNEIKFSNAGEKGTTPISFIEEHQPKPEEETALGCKLIARLYEQANLPSKAIIYFLKAAKHKDQDAIEQAWNVYYDKRNRSELTDILTVLDDELEAKNPHAANFVARLSINHLAQQVAYDVKAARWGLSDGLTHAENAYQKERDAGTISRNRSAFTPLAAYYLDLAEAGDIRVNSNLVDMYLDNIPVTSEQFSHIALGVLVDRMSGLVSQVANGEEEVYAEALELFTKLKAKALSTNECEKLLRPCFELVLKRADEGEIASRAVIVNCYTNGHVVERNLAKAAEYAADEKLQDVYTAAKGSAADIASLFPILLKRATAGSNNAGSIVRQIYAKSIFGFFEGEEAAQTEAAAVLRPCFDLALEQADQGDEPSREFVAACYEDGIFVERSISKAVEYSSTTNVKNLCSSAKRDDELAKALFPFLLERAKAGSAQDAYLVGKMHMKGVGVEASRTEALFWFEKIQDQVNKAKIRMGQIHEENEDNAKAFECFLAAKYWPGINSFVELDDYYRDAPYLDCLRKSLTAFEEAFKKPSAYALSSTAKQESSFGKEEREIEESLMALSKVPSSVFDSDGAGILMWCKSATPVPGMIEMFDTFQSSELVSVGKENCEHSRAIIQALKVRLTDEFLESHLSFYDRSIERFALKLHRAMALGAAGSENDEKFTQLNRAKEQLESDRDRLRSYKSAITALEYGIDRNPGLRSDAFEREFTEER